MSQSKTLLKTPVLKVEGTGITPRNEDLDIMTTTSSRPSSGSIHSDESKSVFSGDAYNVVQSVISMNRALEGQIDALRLRLDIEDKHHTSEKEKIRQEKEQEIGTKEQQIEELRDSMTNRDERISLLVKAGNEKDNVIQEKINELNELKKLVGQSEDYANNLKKQVRKLREERKHLESDTLYKEQNAEINNLKQQIKVLKHTIVAMEDELKRAKHIIDQQNVKIMEIEGFQKGMQKKFKEELDKATKAMRQEVERMREVMNQNYEEMKTMREQNKEMSNDVKDIKQLLMHGNALVEVPSQLTRQYSHIPHRPNSQLNIHQMIVPNTARTPNNPKTIVTAARRSVDQISINMNSRARQASPGPNRASPGPNRATLSRAGFRAPIGGTAKSAGVKAHGNHQTNFPALPSDTKDKKEWIPGWQSDSREMGKVKSSTNVLCPKTNKR
ncbi:golgin IMH1-like [Gigantopelta aegis]|uniref:golgin IMH1-like n=1 Tax=Gigantopelta aegis TaxID=1735272 RepID=UPI001B88E4A7|nr:golgin IMH1-like [Gigantopelta aegis]